jgi:DNA modification methylase
MQVNTIECMGVTEYLKSLPDEVVQAVITSPPYWGLRDYGTPGQLGIEKTPEEYIKKMVGIFREVRRVLRGAGTVWLNMGDSYKGSGGAGGDYNEGGLKEGQPKYGPKFASNLKPKDLCGIPWRLALALQADGWWLRSDIIWAKPNPMPESVTDRPTKAHEYLFLLTKSAKYFYDADAVREPAQDWGLRDRTNLRGGTEDPKLKHHGLTDANNAATGRNKRTVWTIATQPYPEAHFATFPEKLVEPCILAGSREGDTVMDPFMGSGTVALVAIKHQRHFIGCDINPKYVELANKRISEVQVKLL